MNDACHDTEAEPTAMETELCEHFAQLGWKVIDCRIFFKAKAAKCLVCQDAILTAAAADPRRAAVVFQVFSMAAAMLYGDGAATALLAQTPAIEPVTMAVSRTLVGVWGETTPGLDDLLNGSVEALTGIDADVRERCLQAQANLIAAGQDPLAAAAAEALLGF